jgi:multiple sugar transport system substrate-binding protein
MKPIELRGITWNHSRAMPPLVAAAQRFEELHPGIRVVWEKRSLDAFGHAGLEPLAHTYDLLIIDHPMLGETHTLGLLLDLRTHVAPLALQQLADDALGPCLASYDYEGALYALPIDCAAPAASFREDLIRRTELTPPARWDEMIALCQKGLVCMPTFPADLLLNFTALCVSLGSPIAVDDDFADPGIALDAIERLRELAAWMPRQLFGLNPIALYETMSSSDDIAYCPFAYTYSNYARRGFAKHTLLFAESPRLREGCPLRTVLGGTGIAISRNCRAVPQAATFAAFLSSASCQAHIYGMCGGQPASRAAWEDDQLNAVSNDFFRRTQHSIEMAYVRPRYPGYIDLQRRAGVPLADALDGRLTPQIAFARVQELYRHSLAAQSSEARA